MTQIPKHIKLFHNAGIDYITSFIKLWLSFNAWYKKEFEHMTISVDCNGSIEERPVKQDWQAIKKCKEYEKIKGIFNSLLQTSDHNEKKRFLESVTILLKIKTGYEILNNKNEDIFKYYNQSEIRFSDFTPSVSLL